MKSTVLNVSIDTDTPNGELLKNLILSTDYDGAWMCASWVDRTKYNPVELLKESESTLGECLIEQLDLQNKLSKAWAWIEKARDLMVYYNLYDKPSSAIMLDAVTKKFSDLIDEAPI